MEHPATEPPAKQEGKRPSDTDLLGYLTPTVLDATAPSVQYCRLLGRDGTLAWRAAGAGGGQRGDRPARQPGWAYVADYGNDPSWRAAVTQMRPSVVGAAGHPG
jgi:hypothetical protein